MSVSLTIDGRKIEARQDMTVLDAAMSAGIYIPNLCYAKDMKPYGACRLCLVEIDGMRGLPASCSTRVAEGMVVRTSTDQINRVRRLNCELLISDHPSECLTCSRNRSCGLQEVASYLGISESRLKPLEREQILDESNPFYVRDLKRCILCGLCVRACGEVRGVDAIDVAGRGFNSRIAVMGDGNVRDSACVSCGECVDRCPTGALRAKKETLRPDRTANAVCVYCGCGCGLELGVRDNRIVRVRGTRDHVVCRSSLCVKGRFGLDFVGAADRLKEPLIRRNGTLEPASWDEALSLVAEKFSRIRKDHGADALAGLSSAKCSNEENYVFQKFIRATLGTNNVDHCARLCHASTVAGLAKAFGSGAMTNSIDELEFADCIFVTGSNTSEAHPIIAMRINWAVKRGAKLIVADPRAIDITRYANLHIRQKSGTDVALFNAMLNVIITEDLADEEFIRTRTEGFEEVRQCVAECTPEWAEQITGIPAQDIREAARIYAKAGKASIVYSMGITQHTTGTDNVLALANLAMITGNVGRESTGVNPLRGQNNVQGACDLGALPNVYPGYQNVEDPGTRAKFEKAWDAKLPEKNGLTVTEIVNGAGEGTIKGVYIMGENPMVSDPNLNHVKDAFEKLEFLVVQDIFLTQTAEMADVVLPACSFAEKEGTFTNTERRVQLSEKALDPPGQARDDWAIVCDISGRMGRPMNYAGPSEIMDEIASVSPIYGGIFYDRLKPDGLQWPCSDRNHPGTAWLHRDSFKRGLGKFHPTPFREADETPDEEYPYLLTTGRYLYHWHTRTMTGRVAGLEEICPPVPFEIHPADACREKIAHGQLMEISSRRGKLQAKAVITERSPQGSIFMAFHFPEGSANLLTNDALDPVAKIPEYKVCAVRLRPLKG